MASPGIDGAPMEFLLSLELFGFFLVCLESDSGAGSGFCANFLVINNWSDIIIEQAINFQAFIFNSVIIQYFILNLPQRRLGLSFNLQKK